MLTFLTLCLNALSDTSNQLSRLQRSSRNVKSLEFPRTNASIMLLTTVPSGKTRESRLLRKWCKSLRRTCRWLLMRLRSNDTRQLVADKTTLTDRMVSLLRYAQDKRRAAFVSERAKGKRLPSHLYVSIRTMDCLKAQSQM